MFYFTYQDKIGAVFYLDIFVILVYKNQNK